LVVALLQFEHTTVRTASAPVTDPGQSFEAAEDLTGLARDIVIGKSNHDFFP
jgi:hypothetical protein